MVNSLSKAIIKLTTGLTPISVGTKFFPTDSMQNEYVGKNLVPTLIGVRPVVSLIIALDKLLTI